MRRLRIGWVAAMLLAAGLTMPATWTFGQATQWISWDSSPNTIYPSTTEGSRLVLSDTVMVFSGATAELSYRIGSTSYPRMCLLYVRPDNAVPPKRVYLPTYVNTMAFCKVGGEVHGLAINAVTRPTGQHRILYFRCSSSGDILDTLFLPFSGAPTYTAAASMANGKMLIASRVYDRTPGFVPWLGLFDLRRIAWDWQITMPGSFGGVSGAWRAEQVYGNRVLVSGSRGNKVWYSIVDSTGPSEAQDLWASPDTTDFIQARAWTRPHGGWVVGGGQAQGGQLAFIDRNGQVTSSITQFAIMNALADNSFFGVQGSISNTLFCRLDSLGTSQWCNSDFTPPDRTLLVALPAPGGDAIVFGWEKGRYPAMSFLFARFQDVGQFYDPATDSTRFPITGIRQSRKASLALRVWPNPASALVQVQGPAHKTVQLLAAHGRMLGSRRFDGSGRAEIDLSGWPKGIYLLRCEGYAVRLVRE